MSTTFTWADVPWIALGSFLGTLAGWFVLWICRWALQEGGDRPMARPRRRSR